VATLIDKLSVFLPAYNEEGVIGEVALSVKNKIQEAADTWELLIVNDGSSDGTRNIILGLSKNDPRIRLINHKTNQGYGASLQSGLYNSKYPWIAFIDSDGQFDFSEITNLIETQKKTNADLVIGYYKKRQVSVFKIITSKFWELAVFILFGLKARDIDCGFKLVSKKVIDSIPRLESRRGAFISSELLVKAKKQNFKIVEIPVTHYPRLRGTGTGRNLNVIIKSFADLFRLWKTLR
jgi:glycosyltransferase involved in cell wall biosynthesis